MLTDIMMPGLSGYELAAQAKLIRPSLEVLYTSGFDGEAAGRDMAGKYGKPPGEARPRRGARRRDHGPPQGLSRADRSHELRGAELAPGGAAIIGALEADMAAARRQR